MLMLMAAPITCRGVGVMWGNAAGVWGTEVQAGQRVYNTTGRAYNRQMGSLCDKSRQASCHRASASPLTAMFSALILWLAEEGMVMHLTATAPPRQRPRKTVPNCMSMKNKLGSLRTVLDLYATNNRGSQPQGIHSNRLSSPA